MERLNEIMARTVQQAQRRRHTAEQQPPQNTTAQQGQQPAQPPPGAGQPYGLPRPPLREQTGRLGQLAPPVPPSHNQHARYAPPPPQTRSAQGEPPPSLPRPQAPVQRSVQQMPAAADARPTYQQRPRSPREPQYSPTTNYYQADAYAPMAQADVAQEWEDDAAGIRYGDWESDEHGVQAYVRPGAELAPRANRPPNPRELPPTRSYDAQTPRGLQMPTTSTSPLHTPLPSPQVSVQEVPHYQHMTQPLNPRSVQRMSQDMPPAVPPPSRTARPTRQLVPSEQSMPMPIQRIPAPYTAPTEVCPICKGAGYLRADVPFGHPNFGKPIACECKEAERAEKRRLQLYSISNMDAFRNQNFKNFNPNISRSVQRAYQVALEYARDPDGWLVLIGPNGCGKTHLAAAIANQSLEDGSMVLFMTVIDLLDHLRATFVPTSTEVYDQLFSKMCEAGVLILDDLGAQQSSSWANEKLFQLLNYRYNSRFPTVITTNNIGLQGIEERIRSRMMDTGLAITVAFDGVQDYRLRNPRRG